MPGPKVKPSLIKFADEHDYRVVSFVAESPKGTVVRCDGCVTKRDAQKVCDMVVEILKMMGKITKKHRARNDIK